MGPTESVDNVHSKQIAHLLNRTCLWSATNAGQRWDVCSALDTAKPAAQSSRSSSTGAGDGPEDGTGSGAGAGSAAGAGTGADAVTGGAALANVSAAELADMT